jgi:alpha/beta superfamily hydrolase
VFLLRSVARVQFYPNDGSGMYPAGNLFLPVAHGNLEAILKQPRNAVRGVALVLHPHPLGGGTMHNKVVFRAASALNDAGLTTLRINFRGVGRSTGEHDEGRGELEDVRDGLSYLAREFSEQPITLCGFSFGARVGLEVGISDQRVVNLISIGTPVDKYDFSFLEANRKPILFVHGDRDEFGDLDRVTALVARLREHANVELHVIKGSGHFFEGHLEDLKQIITDWTNRQLRV